MKKLLSFLFFLGCTATCGVQAANFVNPPSDVPFTNNGYTYDTIIQIIGGTDPSTNYAKQSVYYCRSAYFSTAKPVIYTSANPANAWQAAVAFKNTYYPFEGGVYYPSPGYPLIMGNTLASNQDFCILRYTANAGATWSTYTASLHAVASFGSGADTLPYTDHVRSNVDLYWASQHFTPANPYYNNQFGDGQAEKFQRLIIPASAFNGGGPQLTINMIPNTGGVVTSDPGTLSCESGTCQGRFAGNVTLTAVPEEGWTFSHWVDGGTNYSDNPRTVFMGSAKTMKAVFHLLSFPLVGYTPYTVPTSSVFDHSGNTSYSDSDHQVVTFAGEASDVQTPYPGTTCYPKMDNSVFGSGFNYVGYGQNKYYLCYNGHPGYDYAVAYGTDVYAAADGVAHLPESFPGVSNAQGYATVEIDHGNGYKTYYLHLSSQAVTENQQVYGGQTVIGHVGHTVPQGSASVGNHLHFEVQLNSVPVDPNGWTGSGADPYTAATNDVLWK